MFAKLIKHEWRATRGVLGLLCAIILGSGIAVGAAGAWLVRMGDHQALHDKSAITVFCTILMAVGIIAVAVCCAGGILYLIYRFHQRCFTDEGYLTFTLPVNTHQILLSSAANTICGSIVLFLAGFAAVMIAMGLLFGVLLAAEWESIIWADALYGFEVVWDALIDSLAKNWGNLLLLLSSGTINILSDLIALMLAVSMGCILAKKHKVFMGVASYYGIRLALGLLPLVFASWGREAFGLFSGMTQIDFVDFMGYSIGNGLVTGAVCYFAMHWLVSRKLNLN